MSTPFGAVAMLVLVSLLGVGCSDGTVDPGPPEINFGRDICIECGMIIDDPRFAASYRTVEGLERRFDDLGGLLLHGRETGELDGAEVWVSDFEREVMIAAASAFYVPTVGVTSPMGHGLLAFSDRARADQMATSLEGEVILWSVVLELPEMEGLVGHHHGSDHGDDDDGHEHPDE